MEEAKLHRLLKDLIKIDVTNYRNFKRLEYIGLEHYGSLFPLMEITFDFLGLEDRPDADVDIMSEAYFNKSMAILKIPAKLDMETDSLVDELFDLLLSYKTAYDQTGRLPDPK